MDRLSIAAEFKAQKDNRRWARLRFGAEFI